MQVPAIVDFVESLIHLADKQGFTPVVTCDSTLRLNRTFYQHLFVQLADQAERPVRIEVLIGESTSWWRNWQLSQFIKLLETCIGSVDLRTVSIEQRLLLSRPAGATRPLTIGLAMHPVNLPNWARLIELTASPTNTSQIQIVAA